MKTSSSEGADSLHVDVAADRGHRRVQRLGIAPGDVQVRAERSHHVDARHADELFGEVLSSGPLTV